MFVSFDCWISECAAWKYASGEEEEGDKDWEGLCENGTRQSPVDLSRRNALPSASIEPIAFIHYGRPVSTNITNNGHTVVLKLDQNEKEIGIAAGGLYNYYILDSIHFHWGGSEHTFNGQRLATEVHLVHYNSQYESLTEAKDEPRGLAVIAVIIHVMVLKLDQNEKEIGIAAGGLYNYYILDSIHFHWGGSEHTFNGQRLATEVHLVHYNSQYESLTEAKDEPRGLAVIAVIIHETPEDNPILAPLVSSLGETIDDPGESTSLPIPLAPSDLLPANRSAFFRYSGSLTTPPCSESVEWTVLYRTVGASRTQLDTFKTLNSAEGSDIKYNYRRTQPHHDRRILFVQSSDYLTVYDDKSGASRISHVYSLALALLCIFRY
ncbi:carbonic anhydrase 1 [Diaphorina citri]|uniref:carbonic anhydrase n=1 Tax=Diaphorina citri TaxID=121845 RepID=A0A1S3DJ44_DIACI|nr:carbonic anhydrase 1 [Diaphorina citri]